MCELFAISSAKAVAVRYSLNEFAKHGGLTHQNKSGWGIIPTFADNDPD
jgi:predicted glutamine amidotransferase